MSQGLPKLGPPCGRIRPGPTSPKVRSRSREPQKFTRPIELKFHHKRRISKLKVSDPEIKEPGNFIRHGVCLLTTEANRKPTKIKGTHKWSTPTTSYVQINLNNNLAMVGSDGDTPDLTFYQSCQRQYHRPNIY